MTSNCSTREWLIDEAGMKQGAVDDACRQLLRFSQREKAFRGSANFLGYMGSGNRNAEIMIVSGSPTESESNTKLIAFSDYAIPMIIMLNKLGIQFEDVYWTTAIKYEGQPTMELIRGQRKYIQEEIIAVNPSIIIAMGSIATSSLFNERVKWDEVDEDEGYEVHENLDDIPVICIDNPERYIEDGDVEKFKKFFTNTWSKLKEAFD